MGAGFGDVHGEGKKHGVGLRVEVVTSDVAARLLTTELADVARNGVSDDAPKEKNVAQPCDLGPIIIMKAGAGVYRRKHLYVRHDCCMRGRSSFNPINPTG